MAIAERELDDFATMFREAIEASGKSQFRVGVDAGVSPKSINSWAMGRTKPRFEELERVCAVIGADWLVRYWTTRVFLKSKAQGTSPTVKPSVGVEQSSPTDQDGVRGPTPTRRIRRSQPVGRGQTRTPGAAAA